MRNESTSLSRNEMVMVMHDQEQEIESLRAKVAELQEKLDNYDIKVSKTGTLAEASAAINDLFETAQATANTYIEKIKAKEARSGEILDDVEKKADSIIAAAEAEAKAKLDAADVEIEEKWAVIESRLLVMYDSHKGLKELVEAGIFNIPTAK